MVTFKDMERKYWAVNENEITLLATGAKEIYHMIFVKDDGNWIDVSPEEFEDVMEQLKLSGHLKSEEFGLPAAERKKKR